MNILYKVKTLVEKDGYTIDVVTYETKELEGM